jgi:hypothetical protein
VLVLAWAFPRGFPRGVERYMTDQSVIVKASAVTSP